jgi:hypothetical protein
MTKITRLLFVGWQMGTCGLFGSAHTLYTSVGPLSFSPWGQYSLQPLIHGQAPVLIECHAFVLQVLAAVLRLPSLSPRHYLAIVNVYNLRGQGKPSSSGNPMETAAAARTVCHARL